MSRIGTSDPIWSAVAGTPGGGSPDPDALARFADLVGAAAVAALVPGAEAALDPAAVRQSRLLNRFRRLQGEKWAGVIAGAGIPVLAIKGLATARTDWPDPDARAVSDADLLVRPDDLSAALDCLMAEGFRFAEMPTRGPWGFVGDASFQPLIGPEDGANIDLHVQGDAWPFETALTAAQLLESAVEAGPEGLLAPAPAHRLLIAASHAAGDLFTADAVKSVVDGLLMLRRPEMVDFAALRALAIRGHLSRPVANYLALLGALGAELDPVRAAGFRLPDPESGELGRVVAAHRALFPAAGEPGLFGRLRREALICAEPRVLLWRNGRRISGMIRPRQGRPDGHGIV
ncbi:MAG: nucleotidyltransferase family protein [Minwuia sp.]|uniref:nucleotidyltransferase family protein n=1 Tax=Minwuia sp. TaxID=2493630 RepID=UPI003A8B8F56